MKLLMYFTEKPLNDFQRDVNRRFLCLNFRGCCSLMIHWWCTYYIFLQAVQVLTARPVWKWSRSVGWFRSQLIWIYTVCKDCTYPGSTGLGLIFYNHSQLTTRVALISKQTSVSEGECGCLLLKWINGRSSLEKNHCSISSYLCFWAVRSGSVGVDWCIR